MTQQDGGADDVRGVVVATEYDGDDGWDLPPPLHRLDADVPSYGRKRCHTTFSSPLLFPLLSPLFFLSSPHLTLHYDEER
jgi:hypothetical protein